jgi:hypothetical protein
MPPPAAAVPHLSRPPAAAAVLPHPPLVVPELAGAAAGELDPLRAACRQALSALVAQTDCIVVVGVGPVWGIPLASAVGSFRPYGADVQAALPALVGLDPPGLPPPARLDTLPLSLAVAAHLLVGLDAPPTRLHAATVPASLGPGAATAVGRALTAAARRHAVVGPPPSAPGLGQVILATSLGAPGPVAGRGVPPAAVERGAGPGPGAGAGEPGQTAPGPSGGGAGGGRVGLVVMADLSACRAEGAPGAFRPEAAGFDASVAEAVRSGRLERLLDLDPASAADLLVAGLVPLQVLAGAYGAEPTPPGGAVEGTGAAAPRHRDDAGVAAVPREPDDAGAPAVRGRVLYEDAPYGVGYLVALLGVP